MTDSIAITAPYVAGQWHPTLNRGHTPDEVRANTTRWHWWAGPCGHDWQDSPQQRVKRGKGCPVCDGSRTRPGV